MAYQLRRNAIAVKTHFRASMVLAYAVPAAVLEPMIGPGLTLDRFGDFGFLAIAMVETCDLRPAFLPAFLGTNFFLSGYRIFVRYRTREGRTLRGLKILRSDTDRLSMKVFGNLLTNYRYERAKILVERGGGKYEVEVTTGDGLANLQVEADIAEEAQTLPAGSPFKDFTEARKFAGPLPFTFNYEAETNSIIRVEGVRQRWNPRPVAVTVHRNAFLEQKPFCDAGAVLANAFYLEDVPYAWKAGVRERLS